MTGLSMLRRSLRLRNRDTAASPRRYTPELVKRYLQRQANPVARDADGIRRMLETLPILIREPRVQRRYRGFQRYVDVLPRILYLYLHGQQPSQIAAALQFLATDYGVETVVDITTQVIAERLNADSLSPA